MRAIDHLDGLAPERNLGGEVQARVIALDEARRAATTEHELVAGDAKACAH